MVRRRNAAGHILWTGRRLLIIQDFLEESGLIEDDERPDELDCPQTVNCNTGTNWSPPSMVGRSEAADS
jgi:hypothetical protein